MKVSSLRNFSVAVASLVSSSVAFTAMDMDARVSQLENQMKQVRTETAMGTYGAQTATARAEVDGFGWFITADVLYWHAKVGGTEFAYTDADTNSSLPIRGRVKDVDFEWDWGFRVGLGYNLKHDGWDARVGYTHFDSSGSDAVTAGSNSSVIPTRATTQFLPNVFLQNCTSAKAQYDFDYQAIDLDLGRSYFVSESLSFRPNCGIKTAWIDQEQTVRYTGGTHLGGNTVQVKDLCDFWGLGPKAGVDSKWYLGNGFSIFGNLTAGLLFGKFDVDHKQTLSYTPEGDVKLSANRHAFSPTAQFQLGLRYERYLNNNAQHIGIGLGYEGQYWWRQNQMLVADHGFPASHTRFSDDASMYGLTLDFKWDF